MSSKEIDVTLIIPIRMTCLASDDSGEVRIKKILHLHMPFIEDIMDTCSEDDLNEIDQAFYNEPN